MQKLSCFAASIAKPLYFCFLRLWSNTHNNIRKVFTSLRIDKVLSSWDEPSQQLYTCHKHTLRIHENSYMLDNVLFSVHAGNSTGFKSYTLLLPLFSCTGNEANVHTVMNEDSSLATVYGFHNDYWEPMECIRSLIHSDGSRNLNMESQNGSSWQFALCALFAEAMKYACRLLFTQSKKYSYTSKISFLKLHPRAS